MPNLSIKATLPLQDFTARWQGATLTERSAAQSHFIGLCQALGYQSPTDADQDGSWYAFERGVTKTSGGSGFADVWLKGHFAWEYKGKHKDLSVAYQQLLLYREDLENPPLLVVCDLDRFEVHTNFTNTAKRVYRFTLADLLSSEPVAGARFTALQLLHALFQQPEQLRSQQTTAQVTEAAAREFAKLSESLRARNVDPELAAHFLMQLLFCLFAEDIGLLPKGLFTRFVEGARTNPKAFQGGVRQLFGAMAAGGWFGADMIAHFNGGLFADDSSLDMTGYELQVLAQACKLDWASVEPAIFGTLFERSLDPGKRAQLGAHYTSRDDILLIVEPVLMAPLRAEWTQIQQQAAELITRRDTAPAAQSARHQQALRTLLTTFDDRLSKVRVLDPACGSGNFLYVALKRLLDLEKEVIVFAASQGVGAFIPQVKPEQLYGIEVNPYAHELAQVVVWIGYIQWLHDNGMWSRPDPILDPLKNIEQKDALLAVDEHGQLSEPTWPEADVITGNPPFLGDKKMRSDLGDEYVEQLRRLYAGRVPGGADLVCYWFERARDQVAKAQVHRVGLLATQGIRGGANRKVLERIKKSGDIFWAQSDRPWVLEGAAVHVSMVGFDDGTEQSRVLDGRLVTAVNGNLSASSDLTAAHQLPENNGICFVGPSPHAPFDVDPEVAGKMLASSMNINGRPNSDIVRPVVSAIDLVQRNRGKWTIDFGLLPLDQAVDYELPFQHVKQYVYPVRTEGRRVMYAGDWWQYSRPRGEMRDALKEKTRFIATPRVSKHRIFAWVKPGVLANDGTIVFARDDDYFFGVLQSHPHELWARGTGTQLREAESGFRYTPTSTFETFPLPWPPKQDPMGDPRVEVISQAARELVTKRDRWLNPPDASSTELAQRTLTKLYNQRPTWLDLAHRKLDEAVLDAYGWPHDLTNEQILERLLALNLERAGQSSVPTGA